MSPKLATVAALAMFAVVACGGSGGSPSGDAPSNGPAQTAASSGDGAVTPAPSAETGATSPASAAAIDPCGLLSAADLKSATAADYGDGVPDAYGQCTWRVGGADVNNGDGQVVAAIQDNPLDMFKSTFAGGTDLTVSGHAAYWNPGQGLQSIWVDIGGRTLVLSFDPVPADGQTTAQKVAELAVAKI